MHFKFSNGSILPNPRGEMQSSYDLQRSVAPQQQQKLPFGKQRKSPNFLHHGTRTTLPPRFAACHQTSPYTIYWSPAWKCLLLSAGVVPLLSTYHIFHSHCFGKSVLGLLVPLLVSCMLLGLSVVAIGATHWVVVLLDVPDACKPKTVPPSCQAHVRSHNTGHCMA